MTPAQTLELAQECYRVTTALGKWTPETTREDAALALISEIGEVAKCLLLKQFTTTFRLQDGKPEGLPIELADCWMVAQGAKAHFKLEASEPGSPPSMDELGLVRDMFRSAFGFANHSSKLRGVLLAEFLESVEWLADLHGIVNLESAIRIKLDYNRNRLIADRAEKVGMV